MAKKKASGKKIVKKKAVNKKTKKKKAKISFEDCINNFVDQIKSAFVSESLAMPVVVKDAKKKVQIVKDFLQKHGKAKKQKNGRVDFFVPMECLSQIKESNHKLRQTYFALDMLPKSFVIMLVSWSDPDLCTNLD